MGDDDVNQRYNTRKKQYVPSKMDYKRGDRSNRGIDGYRHREGALEKLVPWINSLKKKGVECVLLQDGAPAYKSRILREYLIVERIEWMLWASHSPEANASEHAWPWMRRYITKDFTPSCTQDECKQQWLFEWEALPLGLINQWVLGIPDQVRKIIKHHGDNDFHG